MVLRLAIAVSITTLLAACGSTPAYYHGPSFPPTARIDFYLHGDEIVRAHEVMGTILEGADRRTYEQQEMRLAKEAMSHGADGVVIQVTSADPTEGASTPSAGKGVRHQYVRTPNGDLEKLGAPNDWTFGAYAIGHLIKYVE